MNYITKKIGKFELEVGDEPEVVTNPFSGQSTTLEPEAVALYDLIKGAEYIGDFKTVRAGLTLFSKNWPKEYMILLD